MSVQSEDLASVLLPPDEILSNRRNFYEGLMKKLLAVRDYQDEGMAADELSDYFEGSEEDDEAQINMPQAEEARKKYKFIPNKAYFEMNNKLQDSVKLRTDEWQKKGTFFTFSTFDECFEDIQSSSVEMTRDANGDRTRVSYENRRQIKSRRRTVSGGEEILGDELPSDFPVDMTAHFSDKLTYKRFKVTEKVFVYEVIQSSSTSQPQALPLTPSDVDSKRPRHHKGEPRGWRQTDEDLDSESPEENPTPKATRLDLEKPEENTVTYEIVNGRKRYVIYKPPNEKVVGQVNINNDVIRRSLGAELANKILGEAPINVYINAKSTALLEMPSSEDDDSEVDMCIKIARMKPRISVI